MGDKGDDNEAVTLGILYELRAMADEIGHGHMHYASLFHDLLQKVANPNLPDVAQEMGFRVLSLQGGTASHKRVIAVCSNMDVARAAWECACKLFPDDRWLLTWGGMIQCDSRRPRLGD